jgi:hypothetical protein
MSDYAEFLQGVKDALKYAAKNKSWGEILDVIEMINEELEITESLDYISPREEAEDDFDGEY